MKHEKPLNFQCFRNMGEQVMKAIKSDTKLFKWK